MLGPICCPPWREQPCAHDSCTILRARIAALRQDPINNGNPQRLGEIDGPFHTLCPHQSCATIRASRTSDQRVIAFLLRNIDAIRQDETAGDIHRALTRLAARVEAAVDNHQPDEFVGKCNQPAPIRTETEDGETVITYDPDAICGTLLITRSGASAVICQGCGHRYDIEQFKAEMADEAREVWARPREIADFLAAAGHDITLTRLEKWISRDKAEHDAGRPRRVPYPPILQVGTDPAFDHRSRPIMEPMLGADGQPVTDDAGRPVMKQAGKPLFRVGDVIGRCEALKALDEQRKEAG